jgi:hypothetical protein
LGKFQIDLISPCTISQTRQSQHTVLHPYYKLAYIKLAWGGVEEQAEQVAAGYPNAKNWQDEVRKVVESKVYFPSIYIFDLGPISNAMTVLDGGILEDSAKGRTFNPHRCSRRIARHKGRINHVRV